jgi:ankyrin repeat protein
MNDRLLSAATTGNIDELIELLEAGADVNVRDAFGWTPLMWASSMGYPEAVEILLKKGAVPDAVDQY